MIKRRIYAREFRGALGYGPTWFRTMQKRGVLPQGRTDPGGRRQWFTEAEVKEALDRLNATEGEAA